MAEKVIGLKIEVRGTQKQVAAVGALNKSIKDLTEQQKKLTKDSKQGSQEFVKNAATLKELKAQQRAATKEINIQGGAVRKLGNSYNALTERNRILSQRLRQIQDPLGKGKKRFELLSAEIGKNTNKLKRLDGAMGRSFRNVGNYQGAIKKAGAAFGKLAIGITAGIAVFRSISNVVSASIDAYDEQERSTKRLEVALKGNADALIAQSAALQQTTTFGDEATQAAQTQLAILGLNEEQILKLTPLILDLSAATGKDLTRSTKEVVNALATGSTTLEKYGISLDASASLSENLETATIGLEKSVGGAAATTIQGTGVIKQFGNLIGDLQENIGGLVVRAITPMAEALKDGVVFLTNLLDTSDRANKTFKEQANNVQNLEQKVLPLVDRYDELEGITDKNADQQKELDGIIVQLAKDLPEAVTQFDELGNAMGINTKVARELFKEQKALLELQHAEAIEEHEDAIESHTAKLNTQALALEKVNGRFVKFQFIQTKTGGEIRKVINLTAEEINQRVKARKELEQSITVREAAIAKLKGERTEAEKRADANNDEVAAITSLIEIQNKLLEQAKLLPETTEKEIITKNRLIKSINEEIARLKALGIEKDKAAKKNDNFIKEETKRLEAQDKLRKKNIENGQKAFDELQDLEDERDNAEADRLLKRESKELASIRKVGEEKKRIQDEQDELKKEREDAAIDGAFQLAQTISDGLFQLEREAQQRRTQEAFQ